jgi:hypothetical protein
MRADPERVGLQVPESAYRLLMTARMPAFAPELDLTAFALAVLAAVFAPLAVLINSAVAGRMRALVGVCHRNLLCRSLRRSARESQEDPKLSRSVV